MLGSEFGRKTCKPMRASKVLEMPKGRNMNVSGSKNRATSRRSSQRRDFTERLDSQRRDIPEGCIFNVATLKSNVATLQRGLFFKVALLQTNVATLETNVTTCPRGLFSTSRH